MTTDFDDLLSGVAHTASRIPTSMNIMDIPEYNARQLLLGNLYRVEGMPVKDLGNKFPEVCCAPYAIITSFSLESMQILLKNDSGRRMLAQSVVPGKVINRALLTMLLMLVGEDAATTSEVSVNTAPISIFELA